MCQGTIGEYTEIFFIQKIPDIGMPNIIRVGYKIKIISNTSQYDVVEKELC